MIVAWPYLDLRACLQAAAIRAKSWSRQQQRGKSQSWKKQVLRSPRFSSISCYGWDMLGNTEGYIIDIPTVSELMRMARVRPLLEWRRFSPFFRATSEDNWAQGAPDLARAAEEIGWLDSPEKKIHRSTNLPSWKEGKQKIWPTPTSQWFSIAFPQLHSKLQMLQH